MRGKYILPLGIVTLFCSLLLSGCSYFEAIRIPRQTESIHGSEGEEQSGDQNSSAAESMTTPGSPDAVCQLVLQKSFDLHGNRVQIPYFSANYQSTAVRTLNSTIEDELLRLEKDFSTSVGYSGDDDRIRMTCYTDTDHRYMQALVLCYRATELSSGDGSVFSYVYDRQNDRIVTMNETLERVGLRSDQFRTALEKEVTARYGVDEEKKPLASLVSCEPAAFHTIGENPVVYVYATVRYNHRNTESIYTFTLGTHGELRMLPCFVYDPSQVDSLPPQSKLANSSGTYNAYNDTVYGIGLTFPVSFMIERVEEPGYAVFSDIDHTMTATYFLEDGAHLSDIASAYTDAIYQTGEDSLFVRREVGNMTELIFVRQTVSQPSEDDKDEGKTAWMILRCPSSEAGEFSFASVVLSVNTPRPATDGSQVTRRNDAQIRQGLELLQVTEARRTALLSTQSSVESFPVDRSLVSSFDPKQVLFYYTSENTEVARIGVEGRILPLREGTCGLSMRMTYQGVVRELHCTLSVARP